MPQKRSRAIREKVGPDDVGTTVDAYDASFGLAFVGSFPKEDEGPNEEDALVHICMVVGQHYQTTRRILARCERAGITAIVHAMPTCVACIGRVYERNLPL